MNIDAFTSLQLSLTAYDVLVVILVQFTTLFRLTHSLVYLLTIATASMPGAPASTGCVGLYSWPVCEHIDLQYRPCMSRPTRKLSHTVVYLTHDCHTQTGFYTHCSSPALSPLPLVTLPLNLTIWIRRNGPRTYPAPSPPPPPPPPHHHHHKYRKIRKRYTLTA